MDTSIGDVCHLLFSGLCDLDPLASVLDRSSPEHIWGPQGFLGSGENGYLFSGSWGALVIILGELGSKLIILGI